MKTIKRFGITLATHGEMADLSAKLVTILTAAFAENIFILDILTLIKDALAKLNLALTAVRKNSQVTSLNQQDTVRDDAFMMFRDAVAVYARTRDKAKKQAYRRLWAVIEQTGKKLYDTGHDEESGLLKALFQELNKESCQADIALLNTKAFYDDLVTTQNDFLGIGVNRTAEDATKNFPTLKASRKEINPLIEDLLPTLQNVVRSALLNDPQANLDWVDRINEHIEHVATQIAVRRTRKKNGGDDENSEDSEDKPDDL